MWGTSSWGYLIWGGVSVPVLPFTGVMILLSLVAALGWRMLGRSKAGWPSTVVLSLALVVPTAAVAATLVLPHTFVNGTVADADEVNSNFDSVVVESDTQDARLVALEGAALATFSCNIESRVHSGTGGQASCTTGWLTGGGCNSTGGGTIVRSYPVNSGYWQCGTTTAGLIAYVVCCNVTY